MLVPVDAGGKTQAPDSPKLQEGALKETDMLVSLGVTRSRFVGVFLFVCLFVCLVGWLVGFLFGWLVGWLVGWGGFLFVCFFWGGGGEGGGIQQTQERACLSKWHLGEARKAISHGITGPAGNLKNVPWLSADARRTGAMIPPKPVVQPSTSETRRLVNIHEMFLTSSSREGHRAWA